MKSKLLFLAFLLLSNISYGQKEKNSGSSKSWGIGMDAIQQINYPISHSIASLCIRNGNHKINLGPNYTYLFNNYFGDELVNDYNESTIGIYAGYTYLINSNWKRLNFFLQFDYSIYEVNYKLYKGHGLGVQDEDELVIENNGCLGLNFKLSERIEVFGGLGIGSTDYFFLLLDHFIPCSFIGIDVKIK